MNELQKTLVERLMAMGMGEAVIIGVMLTMKEDELIDEMIDWLISHTDASEKEVLAKADELAGIEPVEPTSNWFVLHYDDDGDKSIHVNTDDLDAAIAIFKKERSSHIITYIESINADINETEVVYCKSTKQ